MSSNTTTVSRGAGWHDVSAARMDREANGLDILNLAFGSPGADPAPGAAHGHGDWASNLEIPEMVERTVHFVAGHEIRNSFPLDSVMRGAHKPENCHEVVYPGAHSDVGGGYRPGEGGRSASPIEMPSLVPLRAMYDEAASADVPLLMRSSWRKENKDDFDTDAALADRFNHYLAHVGAPRLLGDTMNAHMAAYYAWRFQAIRVKHEARAAGQRPLGDPALDSAEAEFRRDRERLDREIERIGREDGMHIASAQRRLEHAHMRQADEQLRYTGMSQSRLAAETEAAEHGLAQARDQLLRAKARRDTLPSVGTFAGALDRYDSALMADAEALSKAAREDARQRREFRPHYRALLDAYEDEFVRGRGLRDERLIAFFAHYVHDSLAGFDRDATMPSDPRVVYLGGNTKSRHARSDAERAGRDVAVS